MKEEIKDRINQNLAGMHPYTPGEQPTEAGWVKLNTNEFPYPPAPAVAQAIRSFDPEGARKYPPPDSPALREAVGRTLDWPADGIIVTNGSDEGLRMLCHALLNRHERIGMLWPTYSLYPILGRMFGAQSACSPVGRWGEWPERIDLEDVKMFFLANPNPPFGTMYNPDLVEPLAAENPEVFFVIDEAYAAFASTSCLPLLNKYSNVIILRTFSKSHALAGLRVGLLLAHPDWMGPLRIVRDSYNVNALSQTAALAAWNASDYYEMRTEYVKDTRSWVVAKLADLGFDVLPSEANFLFARHHEAERLFFGLKQRRILVRYFESPETNDGLRITVGTPEEMDSLIGALMELLKK